jgi:hypothetical protein
MKKRLNVVNPFSGRLWDVLNVLRFAAAQSKESEILFKVLATIEGKDVLHDLKAVCGPGDKAEPVITVMLPEED